MPTTTTAVETTSTTARSTTTVTTLPGRPRETTTIPVDIQPGGARLSGTVVGPQGPVAGAVVHVERIVGSEVAEMTLTAADGSYDLPSVRGGNYRMRAWKAPDLAQFEPHVFFLAADEHKTVELRVARIDDVNLRVSVEPDPPVAGEVFDVGVFVYAATVNAEGAIQGHPRSGQALQIVPGTGLSLVQPGTDRATTDTGGRATFRLRCLAAGPIPADLLVGTRRLPLELPRCVAPG